MGCDRSQAQMCDTESGQCVDCVPDLGEIPWNTEVDPPTCSTPERPVKHYPETEECPVLTPTCEPPPPDLPEPQCPSFTDRGGMLRTLDEACDCYLEWNWIACPDPPPDPGDCVFYGDDEQGDHWKAWTPGQKPTEHYDEYRKGVIAVGDTCGDPPMESLRAIAAAINEEGVCAKQEHDSVSILRPSDGFYEEWHAIYFGNGCTIDGPNAHKATWEYLGPKGGDCPLPHPDVDSMKFTSEEKGSHLDTTWTCVGQCEFCESIGYCCMPGTGPCDAPGCVARCGCPVRGDGDPIRGVCEQELCDQKWECDGEAYPPYRGNYAQTDCRGHWKTYCANAPTVAEGNR